MRVMVIYQSNYTVSCLLLKRAHLLSGNIKHDLILSDCQDKTTVTTLVILNVHDAEQLTCGNM